MCGMVDYVQSYVSGQDRDGEFGGLTVENDAGSIRLLHVDNLGPCHQRIESDIHSVVICVLMQLCNGAEWLWRVGYDQIEYIPARLHVNMQCQ